MFRLCNHDWKLICKTASKPKVQVARENGVTVNRGTVSMLECTVVTTLACNKCGKLRNISVTN